MLQIWHLPHTHLSRGLREQLNVPKLALLLLHAGAKPHSPHLMGHPSSQWVLASSLLAANTDQQALVSLYQEISCSWTCLIMVKSISPHQAGYWLYQGSSPLCPQALLGAVLLWPAQTQVPLAPWHKAPGQNWENPQLTPRKGRRCFTSF